MGKGTGTKRGSYSTGKRDAAGTIINKSFPKSYRLTTYNTFEHHENYTATFQYEFEDFTPSCDKPAIIIRDNLRRAKVDFKSYKNTPIYEELRKLSAKLAQKGATRGKRNYRISHPVIKAHKCNRQYITVDGKTLVHFDLKTAYPYFLLEEFTDPAERERYQLDYQSDIYEKICPGNRTTGKDHLMKFCYHETHKQKKFKDGKYRNRATQYFSDNYPITFAKILTIRGGELNCMHSRRESEIFNDFLMPLAQDLGIWAVSMFDGFITTSREGGVTLKTLSEVEMEGRFGVRPLIKEVLEKVYTVFSINT